MTTTIEPTTVSASTFTLTAARAFIDATKNLKGAVDIGLSAPLNAVKVEFTPTALIVTGTHFDLGLTIRVQGHSTERAVTLLPYKAMLKVVPKMFDPAGPLEISLSADKTYVTFAQGPRTWELGTVQHYDAEADFPAVVEPDNAETLVATFRCMRNLYTAHQFVNHALAKEDNRPILTGALVKFGGDRALLVATDSYRLSLAEFEHLTHAEVEVIIPGKGLAWAMSVLDPNRPLTVRYSKAKKTLLLVQEGIVASFCEIEGRFPNYESIIPRDLPYFMRVKPAAMLKAFDGVAAVAHKNRGISTLLDFEGRGATVEAEASGYGVARHPLPALECKAPADAWVSVNHLHIKEAVKALSQRHGTTKSPWGIDAREIRVELCLPTTPFVLMPAELPDDFVRILEVVMPVNDPKRQDR